MKNFFHLKRTAGFCALFCLIVGMVSCDKTGNGEDEPIITGDYRENKEFAVSNSTIAIPAYLSPTLPDKFVQAATDRLQNIVASPEEASLIVTDMAGYDSGIVPDGKYAFVWKPSDRLLKELGFESLSDSEEEKPLYIVLQKGEDGLCVVNEIHDENDLESSLNSPVNWINSAEDNSKSDNPFGKEYAFDTFFSGHIDEEITHVVASKHDHLEGDYKFTATAKVTPLHGFSSSAGGAMDYYIVKLSVRVESGKMYKGNFTKMHGMVKARICGYYLRSLGFTAWMTDSNSLPIKNAVFIQTPVPETTVGATSYSTGTSFSLAGGLTAGTKPGLTYKAGVSFSNSQSHTISDANLLSKHKGADVHYDFVINNLPSYSPIKINNPPEVSTATAEFNTQWIWGVPTPDKDSKTQYKVNLLFSDYSYGASYFYSSNVDYHDLVFDLPSTLHKFKLPIPNRWPTGKLDITNNVKGTHISNITLKKDDYEHKDDGAYESGRTFTTYLPVGEYTLTCKIKERDSQDRSYIYSTKVKITEGDETNLVTGYGFKLN